MVLMLQEQADQDRAEILRLQRALESKQDQKSAQFSGTRTSEEVNTSLKRKDSDRRRSLFAAGQATSIEDPCRVTINNSTTTLNQAHSSFEEMPDVVFAYADIMRVKLPSGEYRMLKVNQMLQPDLMYDKILHQIYKSQIGLTIKRTPLNYKELQGILLSNIKIFFILCHGEERKVGGNSITSFCLEKEGEPTELDEFDEERLKELLRSKIACQTIVISACHSSRLAEILYKHGDPNNTVVAINSREPVLEKAAQTFNEVFLRELLHHKSISDAYEHAIGAVGAGAKTDMKVCCCMHDHKQDCLWWDYRAKYGPEKAHELHTPKCKCYVKSDKEMYNDHSVQCEDYHQFYTELRKMNHTRFLECQGNSAYVQQPPTGYCNKRMIMCCCASDLSHNERQKFILYGNKNKVVFSDAMGFGDVIEQKQCDFSRILLPENSALERNFRAAEKIHIIKFLMDPLQRVLKIIGESGISDTLVHAVKYAAERNSDYFSHGAIRVDLEGVTSIKQIFRTLFKKLHIYLEQDPAQDDVILWFREQTIRKKSFLLVFDNFSHFEKAGSLIDELNKFFQELVEDTKLMKLIIIAQKDVFTLKQQLKAITETIEWKPYTRKQLVEIFKACLETKNLLHYTRNMDVDNHNIFKLPQLGITDIYHIIDMLKNYSLDEIETKLTARIDTFSNSSLNRINSEILSESYTCNQQLFDCSQFVIDFVFFLSQIPRGLCTVDLDHFAKLYPGFLGYPGLELHLNVDENDQQLQQLSEDSQDSDLSSDVDYLREREHLMQFVEIDVLNELESEHKFNVKNEKRKAIDHILANMDTVHYSFFTRKDIKFHPLVHYQQMAIGFMSLYGSKLMRKFTQKNGSEVNHNLLTLALDYGMWNIDIDVTQLKHQSSPDPKKQEIDDNLRRFQDEELYNAEERFLVIEQSFSSIFEDWDKIQRYFQRSTHQERTFLELVHLAKLIPSLLVEQGRADDAISLIENIKSLSKRDQFQSVIAQLNLIQASLSIHKMTCFKKHAYKLIKLQIFESIETFTGMPQTQETIQGCGEAYYLLGLLKHKRLVCTQIDEKDNHFESHTPMPKQQQFSSSARAIEREYSKPKSLLEKKRSQPVSRQKQERPTNQLSRITSTREFTASDLLQMALEYFQKIEGSSCDFGIAKCLIKIVFCKLTEIPELASEMKTQLHENVDKALQIFASMKKGNQEVKCKILKSMLFMAGSHSRDDRDAANQYIDSARQIFETRHLSDIGIIELIVETKRKILFEYRSEEASQSFFNLGKANSIVEVDTFGNLIPNVCPLKSLEPIVQNFIKGPFSERGRFNYKMDILTEKMLGEAFHFGMRVLHLSSDFDADNGLAVEKDAWTKKILTPQQLRSLLQSSLEEQKSRVNLVVLQIPKSAGIAKVFAEVGVKHVLAFDDAEEESKTEISSTRLAALKNNYIMSFCVEFFNNIASSKPVTEAFAIAKRVVTDEYLRAQLTIQDGLHTKMFQKYYQTISEISVRPVLLQHPGSEKELAINFEPGQALNCSFQQGILKGFPREDLDYFGRKAELFQTLKWVTNETNNIESTRLVHVHGLKDSGKSLFIRTIGRLFFQRNMFAFKISYIDMANYTSAQMFKELIHEIDTDWKASLQINDHLQHSQNEYGRDILLLFDNVNQLSPWIWEQFEHKLAKLCLQKNIKIIITSTDTQDSTQNLSFSFFRLHDDNWYKQEQTKNKILMREIVLNPLTDDEALALLLNQCEVEIAEEDLDPMTTGTIRERIKKEESFKEQGNLPGKIATFAKLLGTNSFTALRKHKARFMRKRTLKNQNTLIRFTTTVSPTKGILKARARGQLNQKRSVLRSQVSFQFEKQPTRAKSGETLYMQYEEPQSQPLDQCDLVQQTQEDFNINRPDQVNKYMLMKEVIRKWEDNQNE